MKPKRKQRSFIRSARQVENLIKKKLAEIEAIALDKNVQHDLFPNTLLPRLVEELELLKGELAYKRQTRRPPKTL